MPDITALELVNTVLNFHRFAEVTDFQRTESKVALKVVNMAIDKVLNSNDWEFARRHDGVLITSAAVEKNEDDNPAFLSGLEEDVGFHQGYTLNVNYSIASGRSSGVTRFVNLDGATGRAGDVGISYCVDRSYYGFIFGAPGTLWNLNSYWLGPGIVTGHFAFYTAEYALPTYVRGLISATRQGSGRLDVHAISPEVRLEELWTDPYGNRGDETRSIYQGGSVLPTALTESGTEQIGLRVILHPVPETEFKLDYSYWYLYPQLAAPADLLQGISQSAAHDVVNWAYAHSNLTQIGNDPKLGTALKNDTRYEISETRRAGKAAMSYDGRITPWGSVPRGGNRRNSRDRWDSQRIIP